jgi:glycosyltransferase involved in cell wall biosynthesis
LNQPVNVAVVADLIDEGWPSMDLVADMLMSHLGRHGAPLAPVLLRPAFPRQTFSRVFGGNGRPLTMERVAQRFWTYPRWLRRQPGADVYHIIDHSYAHLASELPRGRVITTCHDTDAFRTVLYPESRESSLPEILVRRVLKGLQRSALVVCDSEAVRTEVVQRQLVPRERTRVVPLGVHPSCGPDADSEADRVAAQLVGPANTCNLLHVGSTIGRKRIDVLLETFARVAARRPDAMLWRVGGPFTTAQEAQARRAGVQGRIRVLPFVERDVLAALYRRAAIVLLPSDREGFGLPVAEALACGTPVIASDLAVLREVGGQSVEYCAIGEATVWSDRVLQLLAERESNQAAWTARRAAGLSQSKVFSWKTYAKSMEALYVQVGRSALEVSA